VLLMDHVEIAVGEMITVTATVAIMEGPTQIDSGPMIPMDDAGGLTTRSVREDLRGLAPGGRTGKTSTMVDNAQATVVTTMTTTSGVAAQALQPVETRKVPSVLYTEIMTMLKSEAL